MSAFVDMVHSKAKATADVLYECMPFYAQVENEEINPDKSLVF